MIPVLTSFLPPTQTHLYLPALFKLWEAFNSSVIDDRLLELAGELSEEHVSGVSGSAVEEGGAQWKDVGLWTAAQWNFLVSKGLGSMSKLCPLHVRSIPLPHLLQMFLWGHCRVLRQPLVMLTIWLIKPLCESRKISIVHVSPATTLDHSYLILLCRRDCKNSGLFHGG